MKEKELKNMQLNFDVTNELEQELERFAKTTTKRQHNHSNRSEINEYFVNKLDIRRSININKTIGYDKQQFMKNITENFHAKQKELQNQIKNRRKN